MPKSASSITLHIALFPFMSKGHTLPLLHLTKLLHRRRPRATFTIFTTPANEPFISSSLSSLSPDIVRVIALPLHTPREDRNEDPESDNNDLPPDQFPPISLFHNFVFSLDSLLPVFETTLQTIQNGENPITFLIYDFFLYWIPDVTSKFSIPILYFNGMNAYAVAMSHAVNVNKLFDGVESMDEAVQIPGFDRIKLTGGDFNSTFIGPKMNELSRDLLMKVGNACFRSHGVVVNSFEELELEFLKYMNSNFNTKVWAIGPFCLVDKPITDGSSEAQIPLWLEWLNKRKKEGKSVLYVAFGTQAEITNDQLKEMASGLEDSDVDFLWALRINPSQEVEIEGFEERVKDKGIVVRGWVEQRAILEHESVQGFLSHCGWNSILESICAGVPILARPMMADQHLNARMVVEEVKVGLRVETCDGSVRGSVKSEGLSKMVKELMGGESGEDVRKNVREYSLVAKKAVQEGGSSWLNLDTLLNEFEATGI